MPEPERIVAAAVRQQGIVYSLPQPARHHDVIHHVTKLASVEPTLPQEQGFLTSRGCFVRRLPALRIAREAGQILRETAPAQGLFSEDVW